VHPAGQTIHSQIRDAAAVDEDLRTLHDHACARLGDNVPIAAVLCTCNGRGVGLFDVPDHDVATIAERLGPLPLAGLFCNGAIGPIGPRPFVHGVTASRGLLIRT
jgi:small ligand-binding sensory domain FIST